MRYAVDMQDIVKRFGRRTALDGLTLQVPVGTVCGLVGSNGAGKTTAMAILSGVLRADRGSVNLLEAGPYDPVRMEGRFTLLPQDAEPPREGVVGELLHYYARLQGLAPAAAAHAVRDVLEWVHLADRATSPLRTLSHGMKRRLAIAQAFLGDPDLVLLDEPFSGLDPREVVRARGLLAERKGRRTILISSHNLHEIELMCDHVVFIEKGRAVRSDSMEAITGRLHVMQYLLEEGPPPLERLANAMPEAIFEWEEAGGVLTCRWTDPQRRATEVNRVVLEVLLDAGLGLLAVRQGTQLESVYLKQSA